MSVENRLANLKAAMIALLQSRQDLCLQPGETWAAWRDRMKARDLHALPVALRQEIENMVKCQSAGAVLDATGADLGDGRN